MRARLRDERRDLVMGAPAEEYDWDDNALGRLRALWAEGHSTAEIGRRLGVSKNAIVGKAHRLNLPARPSPIRRSTTSGQVGRPTPAPRRVAVPKLAEMVPIQVCALAMCPPNVAATPDPPSSPPSPVLTGVAARRATSCCWSIGDPGTPAFRFCDNPAPTGKPYCAEHAFIAYRPRARGAVTLPADV
jgi:GcrA cell cycle regulator